MHGVHSSTLQYRVIVHRNMSVHFTEGETRGLREKRGSRGRGRKGSDEESPRKKKMKNRCVIIQVFVHITNDSLICTLFNHVLDLIMLSLLQPRLERCSPANATIRRFGHAG